MRIFSPVISLVACRAGLEDNEAWAGFSMPRRGNSLDLAEAYNLPRLRYSSSVKSTAQSSGGRSSSESSQPSLSRSKSLTTNGSSRSTRSQSKISLETVRNLPSLSRRGRRRKLEKQIEEEWELKTPEQVHMERESERQRQKELAKEIEREERRAFLGMWSDFQSSVPQVRRARLASEGRIRFSDSEETDSLEAENVRIAERSVCHSLSGADAFAEALLLEFTINRTDRTSAIAITVSSCRIYEMYKHVFLCQQFMKSILREKLTVNPLGLVSGSRETFTWAAAAGHLRFSDGRLTTNCIRKGVTFYTQKISVPSASP